MQDGSNNRVGNHMVFIMIHCTEKITDSYFFRNGNAFWLVILLLCFVFVLVLVIVSIKVPTLGKYSIKKSDKARVY